MAACSCDWSREHFSWEQSHRHASMRPVLSECVHGMGAMSISSLSMCSSDRSHEHMLMSWFHEHMAMGSVEREHCFSMILIST